mgnify:CR=1 FL=1
MHSASFGSYGAGAFRGFDSRDGVVFRVSPSVFMRDTPAAAFDLRGNQISGARRRPRDFHTAFDSASPVGRTSRSKIASGTASVATAFGTSTIPEMRPSQGQHDRSKYTCSSVNPNFARYLIAFRTQRLYASDASR